MTANAGHLQAYLKTWDKHREIWEINKDPFIRRYQRLNPPVSSFDADIARFDPLTAVGGGGGVARSVFSLALASSVVHWNELRWCWLK